MKIVLKILKVAVLLNVAKASICKHQFTLQVSRPVAFISSISQTRRSRLCMVKSPKPPSTKPPTLGDDILKVNKAKRPNPPSIKPPPLVDGILEGNDIATKSILSGIEIPLDKETVKEFGNDVLENYVAPIFKNEEIVRDVPPETLKGALASGAVLSLLTSKGIIFAGATGLGVAYVATTPGKSGDAARVVGKVVWTSGKGLINLSQEYKIPEKVFTTVTALLPALGRIIGKEESLKAFTQMLIDSGLREKLATFSVKIDDEVTKLVKEAEEIVANVRDTDLAVKEVKLDTEDDDGDVSKLVREAEEAVANVENMMNKRNEEEPDTIENDFSIEKNADVEEVIPIVKEAEEVDLDEIVEDMMNKRKGEESKTVEIGSIIEKDTSVNEVNPSVTEDEKVDLDEVTLLVKEAEEIVSSVQDIIDKQEAEASGDGDQDLELTAEELGKAAREAVEQYEKEQQKQLVAEEEPVAETNQDYERMTVANLKDLLRSRGLKLSGKKADLISRLRESD